MTDYYQILGLAKDCSQADIKKAFKAAAMKYHPDRGGDQEKFKEITSAYEVLDDPIRRAEYDREQSHSRTFNNFSFDDIFININSFEEVFRPRAKRNKDLNINCQISLLDSFQGKQIEARFNLPNGQPQQVSINIPAGINHGSSIRYNNLGDDAIAGVPRGNLTVTVLVQPNPLYHRNNDDLCTIIDINPIESMIGCVKTVKSITNKEFTVKIKPGTETGYEHRIQDQGFFNLQTGKRGRFVIRINIKPPLITNKSLLEKLHALNSELTGV